VIYSRKAVVIIAYLLASHILHKSIALHRCCPTVSAAHRSSLSSLPSAPPPLLHGYQVAVVHACVGGLAMHTYGPSSTHLCSSPSCLLPSTLVSATLTSLTDSPNQQVLHKSKVGFRQPIPLCHYQEDLHCSWPSFASLLHQALERQGFAIHRLSQQCPLGMSNVFTMDLFTSV